MIKKGHLDKTVNGFDFLIKTSLLGRNLALGYAAISFTLALLLLKQFEFSIFCFLGGLAMLWSFMDHLVIKLPKYTELSVIELQRAISKFRIHTASRSVYDMVTVFVWFLTTIPAWLKLKYNISVYLDSEVRIIYFPVLLVLTLVLILPVRFVYKKFENKLKNAEHLLIEISTFEKE
jgi:hypothetical protein